MPTFLDSDGAKQLVAEVKALVDRDYKTSKQVIDDIALLNDKTTKNEQDIIEQKSIVDNHFKDADGIAFAEWQAGYRVCNVIGQQIGDISGTTGAYVHSLMPCTKDDTVTINVRGANNPRAWAYLDADLKVLDVGEANTRYINAVLPKAPESTAYILLNNRTGTGYLPNGYYAIIGEGRPQDRLSALEASVNSMADDIEQLNDVIDDLKAYIDNKIAELQSPRA